MKILFQSRRTLFAVPGGDTIQVLKTAEALRERGCSVDISTELEPNVTSYDIVHLFNLIRPQELYLQALNAKRQNLKIALSTIYVSYLEYEKYARSGLFGALAKFLNSSQIEYLKVAARAVRNRESNKGTMILLAKGYKTLQEKILEMADVILPNSESEMRRVRQDFTKSRAKSYVVVPNAVDADLFNPEKVTLSPEIDKFKNCILCVARIEGRKGQLNLVRAVKSLPCSLVLIGKPAPNHHSYFEQVKKESGPNVHIIGEVEHRLLPQYYKAAKVHALVSWMETTGLSSLEAGAMGCNLVITDKGDTRDYFGDYALYCEPDSVGSIRAAIKRAYESPVSPVLRKRILDNYTWVKTAEKTLDGYTKTLNI